MMNDKQKKRLLFTVNGFGIGGGELKLLELIERLDRRKYDPVVVAVGQGGPLQAQFRQLGCPTYVLKKRCGFDLSLPLRLARLMRTHACELVMSTLFYADVMSALATWYYKPRALVSWEVITGRLKWYQKLAYRRVAGRFDHVAAVSNSIHEFIIKDRGVPAERISTIYYGVDLQRFQPQHAERDASSVVFGTVARLALQKGHTYLAQAIPAVLQQHPRARWRWVGDGDRRALLQHQLQQSGVAHAVEFLGRRSDVASLLPTFDVFILPSLWEGFPNVVLEAMACGKPVIATAVEGTVELVRHGETGLLVPKEDGAALAEAMNRLAADERLRKSMGEAGRKRVAEQFSVTGQIAQFEALFDRLLAREG